MPKIAGGFQEYAVHLSPNDATLWLNLGTIRRSSGSLDGAAAAYKHSISLDAGNALKRYDHVFRFPCFDLDENVRSSCHVHLLESRWLMVNGEWSMLNGSRHCLPIGREDLVKILPL